VTRSPPKRNVLEREGITIGVKAQGRWEKMLRSEKDQEGR